MGVKGLLPQLKEIQECLTLERFRGKTLAIDSYAWLHRSIISCSWELAQDLETTRYIGFFRKKIMMLRHFGVEPFFVFDGDNFQSKIDTEMERELTRMKNKEKGDEFLKAGNKKLAMEYFMKSIDVTPSMAKAVIEFLKAERLKFVVAPYEADSQMVYLEKLGLVDGIISEDSDLLIFGAQCLLTKLNDFGECVEIRRENFKKCRAVPIGLMNDSQLRMVACLSGCDYTNGIPGIGIVKAFRLVKTHSNMSKCLMSLRLEGKMPVPSDFEMDYKKADLSFQFQRVFNPETNEITTLNEITPQARQNEELLLECIGPLHDNSIHEQIALGELDPISKEPLISREDIVRTRSFNVVSTPVQRVKDERIAKRSLSTPVSSVSQRIDSFFKVRDSSTITRSATVPKVQPTPAARTLTPQSLSPTSKRRKLFNNPISTIQTPSSSKFFPSKKLMVEQPHTQIFAPVSNSPRLNLESPSIPLESLVLEKPMLLNLTPTSTQTQQNNKVPNIATGTKDNKTVLNELNSSDFDLTDPDDDVDELKCANEKSRSEENSNECMEDSIEHNIKTASTGSHISDQTHHGEIARGLYQRFGFNSTVKPISTRSKIQGHDKALKPIQQNRTTTIKTKKSITKHLTLDSFIYRGS